MVGILVSVFLVTAVLGRVWCGWACPQTVYLEFVYRPIERWLDRYNDEGLIWRIGLRYSIFLLISVLVAHIFLAYFVGVNDLFRWIQQSPVQHPGPFLIMVATTALMMFDFCYFREQTCTLACPYGRFQSVLLDRDSLVITYDQRRGEPRGKLQRHAPADGGRVHGDCVDCKMCVTTCPTGIDIRNGMQMECIGCAQCIDACDRVMTKIGRQKGLIRYTSEADLDGARKRFLRSRNLFYISILGTILVAFGLMLGGRQVADVTLMRNPGYPYTVMSDGSISNGIRLKVVNRAREEAVFDLVASDNVTVSVVGNEGPIVLGPRETRVVAVMLSLDPQSFINGRKEINLTVRNRAGYEEELPFRALGPVHTP